MSEKQKVESAFPVVRDDFILDRGMTLRDYFAAHSLGVAYKMAPNTSDWDDIAKRAYQLADEMLKQRSKNA